MLGAFVEVSVEGRELSDVIRLNRDYLRDNDRVWVMEEGVLRIRDVDVAFLDAEPRAASMIQHRLTELQRRELVEQITTEDGLRKALAQGPVTAYCGFDPTADSLHIGSLVPLLMLAVYTFVLAMLAGMAMYRLVYVRLRVEDSSSS